MKPWLWMVMSTILVILVGSRWDGFAHRLLGSASGIRWPTASEGPARNSDPSRSGTE